MASTIDTINTAAQDILNAKKMFTQSMAKRVTTVLCNIITNKKSTILDKRDVEQIAEQLTINGNRSSLYTWLHEEFFNRLIVKLRNARVLVCPFIINTARKRHRDLIFFFDRKVLADVPVVTQVMNYLVDFADCTDDPIVSPEIDMVCSYVASSILFSHVFFPSSYKSLLLLKKCDVPFEYNFINIQLKDEPVFCRYFLSFHSATRLFRLLRYYLEQCRCTPEVSTHDEESGLFPLTFPLVSFPDLFKKWLTGVIIKTSGKTTPVKLNLTSFTKAARCMAVLESYSQTNANAAVLPCFIHAINARGINSYSYPDFFLSHLLKDFISGPYTPSVDTVKGTYKFTNSALESVISQITKIRRGVYNNADLTAKERLREIERIPNVVSDAESSLQRRDLVNIKCFAEWIVTRYRAGAMLKTINDYASMIPSFLDTLSTMNKEVTQITDNDLVAAFQVLKNHYDSRGIKTRVKDYIEYVTSEYGSNISDSIWKKKGTRILERRTQKPFISYDHITAANNSVLHFLAARQVPSKIKTKITLKMNSPTLIHKALNMKHAYSLSFFTGLRREEVLTRKVSSIRYDDGPILEIEDGKTSSSERTIPLFLLMPDGYLSDFMQFVHDREQKDGRDAYLFVQETGEQWNSKEFIEDIQDLFISLGIQDYVFHNNRGSFASWFLLRWFKVFHRGKIPAQTPFLNYELFQDKYDDRFKQLFWGNHFENKDPFDFSFVNFVVARILGHAGPIITQERYIHTTDWIYHMLLIYYSATRSNITPSQAAHLLQISYSKMLREAKRLKVSKITSDVLLRMQQEYLTRT